MASTATFSRLVRRAVRYALGGLALALAPLARCEGAKGRALLENPRRRRRGESASGKSGRRPLRDHAEERPQLRREARAVAGHGLARHASARTRRPVRRADGAGINQRREAPRGRQGLVRGARAGRLPVLRLPHPHEGLAGPAPGRKCREPVPTQKTAEAGLRGRRRRRQGPARAARGRGLPAGPGGLRAHRRAVPARHFIDGAVGHGQDAAR